MIAAFLMILCRVSGTVMTAPIVGDRQVPNMVKAIVSVILSFILVGVPGIVTGKIATDLFGLGSGIVLQLIVGISLGFLARLLFYFVQTAGQIASLQMGLSTAAVYNPMTQQADPIFSQLYTIVAGLVFLAINGDVWLVASLARSFTLAPLSSSTVSQLATNGVIVSALTVAAVGLQLSLPITASVLIANLVLGIIGRSMPQLNLFILSMPIDFILGLLALIASLAATITVVAHFTNALPQTMLGPLKTLGS